MKRSFALLSLASWIPLAASSSWAAVADASPAPAKAAVQAFTLEGRSTAIRWNPVEGASAYRLEIVPGGDRRLSPFAVEKVEGTFWKWPDAPVGTHLVRVYALPPKDGKPSLAARITLAYRADPPKLLTSGAQEYRVSGLDFRPGEKDRGLELRWSEVPGASFYLVELKYESDPARAPERRVVAGEKLEVDAAPGEDVTWRVRALGPKRDPLGDYSDAVRTRLVRRIELDTPTIFTPLAGEEVNAAYGPVGRMRLEWEAVPGAMAYRVDLEKKDLSTGESFFQTFTTSASTTTADFELGRTERAQVRFRVRAEAGESTSRWDERRFEAVRSDEPLPSRTVRAEDFQGVRVSLGLGLSSLSVDQQVPVDAAELPAGQAGALSLGSFQGQAEWWPRRMRGHLGIEGSVNVANYSASFAQTGATPQTITDLPASVLRWGVLAKGRAALSPTWSLIGGLGLRSQPRYTFEVDGSDKALTPYTYESATEMIALYHQPRIGSVSLQAGLEVSEAIAFFPADLQLGAFLEGRWWLGSFWIGGRGSWTSSSLYYLMQNVGDPTAASVGATTTSDTAFYLTAGFPL